VVIKMRDLDAAKRFYRDSLPDTFANLF
jgi:catechol 2,3-dioxygenase-like lactoylglutathione lyase family enzyme